MNPYLRSITTVVLLSALSAFGLVSAARAQEPLPQLQPSSDKTESEQRGAPVPVSLIRLLGNPEKFAGHKVRVMGVLERGGGPDRSYCLYVSEVDARNRVTANCIYVRKSFDPTDKHLGKYVIFNATLRYKTVSGKDSLWEFLSFDGVSDLRLWE